jgi:short-subunit dehydrogenase
MITKRNIALVTGGSSGIGFAIACELANKGYDLLLVSNQQNELTNCKSEIEKKYHVFCATFYIDLAQPAAAQVLIDFCNSENFQITILVNNAGILLFSEVIMAQENNVNTILQLHIHTPVLLCSLVGEHMKNNNSGYILNVASISAVMPYPGISLYGPTKTFMRYFTRAFRSEMKLYNVKVTCLLPGATETGLYNPNKINLKLAKRLGIMQSSNYVAQKAINALFKNTAECIPGWLNKITVALLPLVPMFMIDLLHQHTNLLDKGKKSLS